MTNKKNKERLTMTKSFKKLTIIISIGLALAIATLITILIFSQDDKQVKQEQQARDINNKTARELALMIAKEQGGTKCEQSLKTYYEARDSSDEARDMHLTTLKSDYNYKDETIDDDIAKHYKNKQKQLSQSIDNLIEDCNALIKEQNSINVNIDFRDYKINDKPSNELIDWYNKAIND